MDDRSGSRRPSHADSSAGSTTRPLRIRLTVLAGVVTALVLAGASLLLVLLFQRSATATADDLSRSRAADLLTLAARGTLPQTLTTVGDDGVAQVLDDEGRVLAASDNVQGKPALTTERPDDDDAVVFQINDAPDDDETEDYRVWAVQGESPDGPVFAYVGTSMEAVSESVSSLVRSLVIAIPLVLVALIGLVWVLVGRTLRPVEAAHARQRAFVADASHELQSPLASFRAQLEVALEHPAGTDWEQTARDLLSDSDQMESLVRDLLFLARQDEGPAPPGHLVDLDDVVLEEVARLRSRTTLRTDTQGVSAAPVRGSRDDLARVVRNLLDNAAQHARSAVTVTSSSSATGVVLAVSDDGPGVAPEQRAHLFERFYRGDEARWRAAASTGLGLPIVAAVVARHGGWVEVGEPPSGARFVVHLPTA
ncbi:MAG: sensor histidine kinase [Nocardioidaceae bacterium]